MKLKSFYRATLAIATVTCMSTALNAQVSTGSSTKDVLHNKEGGEYNFTVVKDIEATEVQSQGRTGTCWSFSALSYFESEVMRMGKGKHILSEMFIVRHTYMEKAEQYVRMHGTVNFGEGGAFHDVPHIIAKYGMVPESEYMGNIPGQEKRNHAELEGILKATLDAVIENKSGKISPAWRGAVNGILDAYLGELPKEFTYKGKKYTPMSYAKMLGLKMEDYIGLSSYTHHDFYDAFIIEVPDNWAWGEVYNLPIDELVEVMDDAIKSDFSLAWASDVSEKGFSFRDGLAIVPAEGVSISKKGKDNQNFSDAGAEKESSAFDSPQNEKEITQEMRQTAFDNFETTDDHGMHITGIVKDQNGTKYYIVKNSWGTDYNDCDGYFYASEAFVRYKTMDILIHKDALTKKMKKKLGLN